MGKRFSSSKISIPWECHSFSRPHAPHRGIVPRSAVHCGQSGRGTGSAHPDMPPYCPHPQRTLQKSYPRWHRLFRCFSSFTCHHWRLGRSFRLSCFLRRGLRLGLLFKQIIKIIHHRLPLFRFGLLFGFGRLVPGCFLSRLLLGCSRLLGPGSLRLLLPLGLDVPQLLPDRRLFSAPSEVPLADLLLLSEIGADGWDFSAAGAKGAFFSAAGVLRLSYFSFWTGFSISSSKS